MFRPDYCNSYPPPGLKFLLSVAPKIQTSLDRSYRKCWNFPARESYCFTLIVFVLTRQETIKNNNTEQYLLFSNSGRFFWYVCNTTVASKVFELRGRWFCYALVLATFVFRTTEALSAKQWKRSWKEQKMLVIVQLKNATSSLIRPCLNFCKSVFPGSSLISYPVNVFRIPLVFWSNSGSREYCSRPSNTKKKLPSACLDGLSWWSTFSAPWFTVTEYIPLIVFVIVVIKNL